MKNLVIGSFIFCAAIGKFVFTQKHFEFCVAFCFVGIVVFLIGAFRTISEFENVKN